MVKFFFGNPDNKDLEKLDVKLEGISTQEEKFVIVLKAEATVVNTTFELAKSNRRILINLQKVCSKLTT